MNFEHSFAEVAQVVEHGSEKAGVGSASLPLGTSPAEAVTQEFRARQLRLDGKSYNEIYRQRLYARARSAGTAALVARNKHQTILARARADTIKKQAASTIGALSRRELLLVGSALYWGEGSKIEGREVAFTNSDPHAVRVMTRFFREICQVHEADFRVHVAVHAGVDADAACRFWSEVTGVSRAQFTKPFVASRRANGSKPPVRRLPHGTCQVRVYDIKQFHQVMGWIAGIQQALEHYPDRSSQALSVSSPA